MSVAVLRALLAASFAMLVAGGFALLSERDGGGPPQPPCAPCGPQSERELRMLWALAAEMSAIALGGFA